MYIKQQNSPFPLICVFITFLLFISFHTGHAQSFADRFTANISVYSTFGSEKEQSFWLTRNRFDMFDQESANGLTILSGKLETNPDNFFDIGGKLDVIARASQNEQVFLHEAYLEAKAGIFRLYAGRKKNVLEHAYENLSTGSMVLSRNVRPLPRISVSVPEFEEVPFTGGWLEFKGHFAHGWFDDDRYTDNPYLHDKSAYLRTGADTGFSMYFGLVHLAIWGGNSPVHGQLPDGLSNFARVMTARAGDEDSPANERLNKLGFHTGIYDWGFVIPVKETDLHFYYQHLFTDGSGQRFRNLGDGLFGLLVKNPFAQTFVTSFLLEYSDTRKQSGPGMSDRRIDEEGNIWQPWFCEEVNCGERHAGRDNYLNNGIYRSGLSYQGNSMGSPFFLTTEQLFRIDPDANPYGSQLFASNRNLSYHLGVEGFFSEHIRYRFFSTYVRYFGTYSGLNLGTWWGSRDPDLNQEDYFFNPSRNQWYFMLETHWQPIQLENIRFTATLAADSGHLYNSGGLLLGINWKLK